jgi:hypothetical protein
LHMRVRVIQSADADWDLSDKIRSALEERITPLELEFETVPRFYMVGSAISSSADANIVLFFPKKEEAAIAGPILVELMKTGAFVIFYFADDLGVYEDDVIAAVCKVLGVPPPENEEKIGI